jgi:hypothetical protein
MRTNFKNMYRAILLLHLLMILVKEAGATTYYSRTSGNWNASGSWSTVTYGDPTNAGTYPVSGDMVYIGDGHTILLTSSSVCAGLNIGQGTSGILEYPNFGTITLTVSGAVTINAGGKLWYNLNNSRTHNLFISTDIINNGTVDLYSDNNDVVNLIFNGAANSNVTGSGTFAFNLVTMSKATRTYTLNVQTTAFLAAASPSMSTTVFPRIDLTKGTFVCNALGTTNWSDPSATSYSIPMDVILEVRLGTVNMVTGGDSLINSGKIYITGGTLQVGNSLGRKGILNRDLGSLDPEIEITAGTLLAYGGLDTYSGSNTSVFKMTGGNLDLNSGSTRTDGYPFRVANVAGSQFIMTSGNIYIRKPSTTASTPEIDFGSSNVYHNVTDGHVYFGDAASSYTFDYMPYFSYIYPNFEVAGTSGTLLRPYTFINSKMLSLKINIGNTFDVSSSGTNATSTQISMMNVLDGVYGFYNEGTFLERQGQIIMNANVPQYYYSLTGEYNFNNVTINNAAGVYLDVPMSISGTLTLTNGIIHSSAAALLTINHNAIVTGASNTSYVEGPVHKIGNAAFTFPVGRNNVYRPISISAPALDTDEYTGEYFDYSANPTYDSSNHDPSIDHISDIEYWILDRNAGTSNVNVTLSWDASSNVTQLSTLRVAQWDGAFWRDQGNGGTTGTTAAGTIVNASGSTTYGPFTLAGSSSSNNPLPVELSAFNVVQKDHNNVISWTTLTEKENDYFHVEKTMDGIIYNVIAQVKGAGTSSLAHNYSVNDVAGSRKACYRLKQIDFNGDFSYSAVKCVGGSLSSATITVTPTALHDEDLVINFNDYSFKNAVILITDITGKTIYTSNTNGTENRISRSEMNVKTGGIYYVMLITDDSAVHTKRIVVI